jgi:hypothetical protein
MDFIFWIRFERTTFAADAEVIVMRTNRNRVFCAII